MDKNTKPKRRLSTEEIMERLRHPAAHVKQAAPAQQSKQPVQPEKTENKKVLGGLVRAKDLPLVIIGVSCLLAVVISFFSFLNVKNKADDVVYSLDTNQIEGLKVGVDEFNPNKDVTYVQVREGRDRNVTNVSNVGSSLPIISRFNLKTFTPKSYELIGAAPWALTTNFSANMGDPALMRTLLDNEDMIQAFLARADVAPLLEDPQLLLSFAKDEKAMADFFGSEVVSQVLADEQMLRNTAGSRFMSYLLISRSGKYFRARPEEALAVINKSHTLSNLRNNAAVRKAIEENPKLGPLASKLLAPVPAVAAAAPTTEKKPTSTSGKKTKKKGAKK